MNNKNVSAVEMRFGGLEFYYPVVSIIMVYRLDNSWDLQQSVSLKINDQFI